MKFIVCFSTPNVIHLKRKLIIHVELGIVYLDGEAIFFLWLDIKAFVNV